MDTIAATRSGEELTSRVSDDFAIHFPGALGGVDQDEEWCEVDLADGRRRFRFHDYHEIYAIPGLYEEIFYGHLKCTSPRVVRQLFEEVAREEKVDPGGLTVLDFGAGNGMVGEQFKKMGAGSLVGIDIIEEAEAAAQRDRPDVYDDYLVLDMTALTGASRRRLLSKGVNCLTTVAALGFGDIPPLAFAEAFNVVSTPGWLAINIKEDFLEDRDGTGFSGLIRDMLAEGILVEKAERRYQHRLSLAGDPLHYVALVAAKEGQIPSDWVDGLA